MVSIIVLFLVFVLSVASSSLSVVKYLDQHEAYILVFMIGGYLLGLTYICGIFAWKFTSINALALKVVYFIVCAFRVVSIIVFVVLTVQSDRKAYKQITTTTIVLALVEVAFIAFSIWPLARAVPENFKEDSVDEDISCSGSSLGTIRNNVDHYKVQPENEQQPDVLMVSKKQGIDINKKVSELTLVDKPAGKRINIDPLEDSNVIDYIISTVDSRRESNDESHYNCTQNWMDSGAKLSALDFSIDLEAGEGDPQIGRRPSRRLFNTRKSIKKGSPLSVKKLTRNCFSPISRPEESFLSDTNEPNHQYKTSEVGVMPDLQEVEPETSVHEMSDAGELNIDRITHIPEKEMEVTLVKDINSEMPDTPVLIRSGSYVNGGVQSELISTCSPTIGGREPSMEYASEAEAPEVSLVPDSVIRETNEGQEAGKLDHPSEVVEQDKGSDESSTNRESFSIERGSKPAPDDEQIDHWGSKSTLKETIEGNVVFRNGSMIEESRNDSGLNLPFMNEFSEPIDQSLFERFDQPYAMYGKAPENTNPQTSLQRSLSCTDFESPSSRHVGSEENYGSALVGLEKIPRISSAQDLDWITKEKRIVSNSTINHISPQNWMKNAPLWKDLKKRSGTNSRIYGISKAKTYEKLNGSRITAQVTSDYLLPPLEPRADDIDNLSDLEASSGNFDKNGKIYSLPKLSRSYSAPSLHSFRDVSGGSKKSGATSISDSFSGSSKLETYHVKNLTYQPDLACGSPEHSPSEPHSPIKRFFQESPKKLNSALKRRVTNSRSSLDTRPLEISCETGPGHKHSQSTASNQHSIASGISSKSTSPRKSLKSLLTSKSYNFQKHSHKLSVNDVPRATKQWPPSSIIMHQFEQLNGPRDEKSDFWDIYTAPSSDKSRVSSVPSAVIGEYDREKWRTMKDLQNNNQDQEQTEADKTMWI